ncbi:MAG: metallopeptidase TldD-related protein, partial [Acidobacteriota bacterium]
ELETIDRAMLVADDDGRVQATSWRWSRLRVGVRADSDAAAVWLGGAATVDALARTHPPAALAIILDRRLRGALTPRAGLPVCTPQTSVLFTAGNGGLVLHEFAHQLEGDLVSRGWSRWGDALQSPPRLSEKLTLWDDPNRVGLRGFYPVDDEGRPGERRLLVRRGRVAGYLGDRRRGTGTPRMRPGHGRRASWREPPAPRAANLCLAAGDADAGAVRDERGRVLVVHDLEGGGTDPRSGEMTVRVNDGEWVEDGRLIAPVAGLDLEGNVLDLLGAVDRLCSDRRPDGGAATCRRQGSGVPIGFLTPSFRTRGLAAFGRLPASRETL